MPHAPHVKICGAGSCGLTLGAMSCSQLPRELVGTWTSPSGHQVSPHVSKATPALAGDTEAAPREGEALRGGAGPGPRVQLWGRAGGSEWGPLAAADGALEAEESLRSAAELRVPTPGVQGARSSETCVTRRKASGSFEIAADRRRTTASKGDGATENAAFTQSSSNPSHANVWQ
ncbi:unnamed protein product [Eretmochelys imbricata]